MLAVDQVQVVDELHSWWRSGRSYHVLNGSAGVGKSYVIDTIIKELPIEPILLAPTHKALRGLRDKTKGDYEFRTLAAALGIRPILTKKDLQFEHIKIPSIWDSFNLCIIDEASMLDEFHIELLRSIGIRILYVGHQSQLPPVYESRSMFDPCESPVFTKDYSQSNLWIPKRNTGKLWEYNNTLEKRIYDPNVPIDKSYDVTKADLFQYILDSLDSIRKGLVKVVLWTNDGVTKYNDKIRSLLYKESASFRYLPGDLVITTNSVTSFDGMEALRDKDIISYAPKGKDIYTDTDGELLSTKIVWIKLNKDISVKCFKHRIKTTVEGIISLYELVYPKDYSLIADYYEHKAWSYTSKEARDRAYRQRALILKCFAQLKHFYAATSHRLQGSSIENVIVIHSDIMKNPNKVERAKCEYVASSRAMNDLLVYRGI